MTVRRIAHPSMLWIDLAAATFLILTAVGTWLFWIQPLLARRKAVAEHTALLAVEREKLSQAQRIAQTARTRLELVQKKLAEINLELEPAGHLNQRLAGLMDLAARHGLVLEEVEPSAVRSQEHYQTVPIRLRLRGSYPQCTRFLERLHQQFPDTAVLGLELTGAPVPAGQGPSAGLMSLQLLWYTAPSEPSETK